MTSPITLTCKPRRLGCSLSATQHLLSRYVGLTKKLLVQPTTLIFLVLLNLFWPASSFAAAHITAAVDRNPISLDESFQIIFTASESPDDNPNFKPLEQDFKILGQSQSSNISVINGTATRSIRWVLKVIAKRAGNLSIPAIKFGDDVSQALAISVTQQAASKNIDTDQELYLEVEATPQSPYVQSQVLYTLRLYRRVDLAQASLSDPELADAVVEKLGDDSNYSTQVNGVSYLVTERKYAIFPQKSGSLTIKPLVLNAEVVSSNGRPRFNGFFNPQSTQTKRIESKAITLDVKPVPSAFTGKHWLSAEQLEIKQEWSGDFQQMKVGEPVTRTLTLHVKGATVGQLPELNTLKTNNQIKAYPDQPTLQEQKNADGVVALREEKIAIIPSQSGDYSLPAIEIPWFNSQTQKMEIAKLPETTITAIAAPGSQPAPAQPVIPPVQQPAQKVDAAAPVLTNVEVQQNDVWMWATLFLAVGWLLTVLYFLSNRRPAIKPVIDNGKQLQIKDSIKRLKKACADDNAHAAKDALLAWGKQQFNAGSLGAIAELCEARLRDEILALNQVLYGKEAGQWQGKKLFQTFTENKARTKLAGTADDGLEPLYRL